MKYKIETWSITRIPDLYKENKLNLNPPYQRNAIWSLQAQRLLIDTIKNNMPMPAFFVQAKGENSYEMVDGQQRSRAILAYTDVNGFHDNNKQKYVKGEFDNYFVAVYILDQNLPIEVVREFYVLVNKSGAKLERPELNKAEFFETEFLSLVTELTDRPKFKRLGVFKAAQIKRMFDRAFVEELVAQLLFGISDKKSVVDQLYKNDISQEKRTTVERLFDSILEILDDLNDFIPISNTRFIQKNDFYTLFGFIHRISHLSKEDIRELYATLAFISKGVSPSNEQCQVLKDYAFHCITQSNSKKARESRLRILIELLLNQNNTANESQKSVATYFGFDPAASFKKIGKYLTFKVPNE